MKKSSEGINNKNIRKMLEYIATSNLPLPPNDVEKYMGIEHESWQRLVDFCVNNNLIVWEDRPLDKSKPTGLTTCIEVKIGAVNYLTQEKRTDEIRRHDTVMKWATVAITLATIVNVVVAYLNYVKSV